MTSHTCPACSRLLPEDAGFCPSCGEPTPTQVSNEIVATGAPSTESSDELEYRHRLARALGDDYELRDLIGRGGFGAVYRAWDKRLDRAVAVKALRHDLFPTPALLQRFDREAKAVAKLRHPNILPVYTVGEGEAIAYMVMPLVEGESLQSCLERQGTISPDETVRIISEAAGALEAAHKLGFVHRDVKPANIMLEGEERRVLLMDFGIAKTLSAGDAAITGTGVIIGSPAYMSPEQARGEKDIDGRSDIYSLGAVAYEMLSGRRPFDADNLHELVYKQVTQHVADLAQLVPGLSVGVGHAVMRCLAKEREHRWQTAADLRRSISTADSATAGFERPAEWEEESWLSRRGPYLLLLGFLLYFIRIFADWMKIRFTPELYGEWTGSSLLAYAGTAVVVLLVAAAVDAGLRIVMRVPRGQSWSQVARFVLGQPDWWQTWYPRRLRVPDSVWDRLPFSVKLLRTLVWIELILVPAGGVFLILVIPTFVTLTASMGRDLPLLMRILIPAVKWAGYATPFTAGFLWWQVHRCRVKHGVPGLAFLASLFNLRGSYWQGSPVRLMLKD